jgi:2-polyprenyl-6-methoxyphenol hydroxylase-like FAD-dependent oxidoreductase
MTETAITAPSRTQVVISGGGPVGLGLAIELGQRGIRCIVVERYPEPQPVPRGQNLTQRTMEHMHVWGVEDALRAARTIPKEYGIGGLTAYGTLLGGYHYDWLQRELVRPYYFTDNERLPQYATEAVLRKRVAELPNVTTMFGWGVEGVEQSDAGVTVTAVERRGNGRVTIEADYAVGCDGSRSTIREAAGITQTRSDHDRLMVLLVFRSERLHGLLERFPGKSFYNVLRPELQGYWQFLGRVDLGTTWFFHAPVPVGTTRDNFDFAAYLQTAIGAEFDVEFQHIGFWDLRFATADTYQAGRAFIAGDAAHSHPPYGGYGINTGFEDARNLGWKLAATLQGWAAPGLLESYSEERQPVFASTARDFIDAAIQTDKVFLNSYDPAVDRAAFEAKWAERSTGASSEVGAFEPNYEGSPIVFCRGGTTSAVGSHSRVARAGHHLSPVTLASGGNVYEAFGAGFSLITFDEAGDRADGFAEAASRLGIPLTLVRDPGGEGRTAYDADLVLVRPDHFVAWTSRDAEADPATILQRAVGAA